MCCIRLLLGITDSLILDLIYKKTSFKLSIKGYKGEELLKMQSITDLIKEKIQNLAKGENPLKKVKRKDLIKELYEVYILENKFENYYRYLHWLKKNGKDKTKENVIEFQKAKLPIHLKYITPLKDSYFAIKLSHIPTPDLFYVISAEKDIINRKGYKKCSFSKWLFYSIK